MNKFNFHDLLRLVLVVLLGLLAWFGRDISQRLHVVELNQVKIMTVLEIEPYSLDPQNRQLLSDFSH